MNFPNGTDALALGILIILTALTIALLYSLVGMINAAVKRRREIWHGLRHPLAALDTWWAEASPRRRLDRNAGNMCMLIGLMLPSLSIVLQGPTPNSTLEDMDPKLQIGMCACIFLGCGVKLHGALAGSKWYFPKTDVKRCYRFGYSGAPMATAGALVYGYYILSGTPTWLSALGGVSTPMFGIGISLQACLYWLEARRIERNEKTITALAKQAIKDDQ